jgi:hypothetical protein
VDSFYSPEMNPFDKSDVIVRVYHIKLEELIHDIKSAKMFGPCNAGTTTRFPLYEINFRYILQTLEL